MTMSIARPAKAAMPGKPRNFALVGRVQECLKSTSIPALLSPAICPFAGYMTDLFGRRNITLLGSLAICVGCILVATAHTFGQALTGMAIAGAGAGIGELGALSGYVTTHYKEAQLIFHQSG